MKFDTYTLKARIIPGLVTIVLPIFVFNHFFVSKEFSKFVGDVLGLKMLSEISISLICLYYLAEFGRFIGKNYFENKIFCDEKYMPTTNFMMFKNKTFSYEFKEIVRTKVRNDFEINWPTADEEQNDEEGTRIRIVETMALIRKKLMGNNFLLQHNIEYGAMRNAIGGATIGVIFSLFNIIFFKAVEQNDMAVNISIWSMGVYFLFLVASKPIINFYGRNYAKILFREYIG